MSGRAAKVAEAQRLRNEGLMLKEIAQRMGCATSTVFQYIDDPDLEKLRARKKSYRGACVDCGTATDGTAGPTKAPARCNRCNGAHSREMTRRWILESFREWETLFGAPPSAMDWNPAHARSQNLHYKADRYEATGRPWPSTTSVINIFGTWNAGRAAAGYETNGVGEYGREGEDPQVIAETIRLYRSGLSLAQVGERMGVTGSAVRSRLMVANEPRRTPGSNPAATVLHLPERTATRKAAA